MMLACLLLWTIANCVDGHGRLMWPPSRSSMWRWGYDNPVNYNDIEIYCGGYGHQWNVNDGKCGVCGDPWDGPWPNEAGGTYANGLIADVYQVGQAIDVTIDIKVNHWGWFEFRLCPNNDPTQRITHACLDQYILNLAGADANQGTRWQLPNNNSENYTISVQLPEGLTCSQCVLQWKYNTANSWGTDPDGRECQGCGPQEQFYGCADISIGEGYTPSPTLAPGMTTTPPSSTTTPMTTTETTTPPSGTTTIPPTTTISSDNDCTGRGDGFYPYVGDCNKFLLCDGGTTNVQQCGTGLCFNQQTLNCDWCTNVPEC